MRAIRRFLCNKIARMGLQKTTNTRDALMIVCRRLIASHATIFCNRVCKGVTKEHSIPEKQHIASHCDATIFCNHVCKVYASQTKILERVAKDEMRVLGALFKGVSTQLGPRTIEKCFENPHFIFCSSFQKRSLRLGSIHLQSLPLPKEDFGRPNQHFRMRFRSTF